MLQSTVDHQGDRVGKHWTPQTRGGETEHFTSKGPKLPNPYKCGGQCWGEKVRLNHNRKNQYRKRVVAPRCGNTANSSPHTKNKEKKMLKTKTDGMGPTDWGGGRCGRPPNTSLNPVTGLDSAKRTGEHGQAEE